MDNTFITTYSSEDDIYVITMEKANSEIILKVKLTKKTGTISEFYQSYDYNYLVQKVKLFNNCDSIDFAFILLKSVFEAKAFKIQNLSSSLELKGENYTFSIPKFAELADKIDQLSLLLKDLDKKLIEKEKKILKVTNELGDSIIDEDNQIKVLKNKVTELAAKSDTSQAVNLYTNRTGHWINTTVNYLDNTPFISYCNIDMLLGKANGSYYLSVGNRDQRITFDLGREYFLKEIKLSLDNFECTLKNFKISVKESNGTFRLINSYVAQRYSTYVEYQYFTVNALGRYFKFDLIDNWGPGGGNYILIKRLYFNVVDTI